MIVYSFFVVTALIHNYVKANPLDSLNLGKNDTTTKNSFVEVIREDLKRNNDDYKELLKEDKIFHSNKAEVNNDNFKKSNIKSVVTNFHKGYRRKGFESYQEFEDYEDTTKSFSKPEYLFKNGANKSEVNYVKHKSQSINKDKNQTKFDNKILSLMTRSTTLPPFNKTSRLQKGQRNIESKLVKQHKILKFKEFMKKNEAILKKYVSGKNAARMQQQQKTAMGQFTTPNNNFKIKSKNFGTALKNIPRTRDKNNGKLPSPELLDMAPAKGGRIQKQRDKGRMCHRHVLMPEGPKYDSRGRWYLPAHELVAARPYERTRAPRLLLPRCCNCCKKSVLGCE